jgi:hypothetical protein
LTKDGKYSLNYLFFGGMWLLLMAVTMYQMVLVKGPSEPKIFFLFFTLGQDCLEVACFIFFAWLISRYFSRKVYLSYIGLVFLLFLTHVGDFILNRLFGFTFWGYVGLVFDEDLTNFIEMLHASGIPLHVWILGGLALSLIPCLGVFLYLMLEKLSQKKPLLIGNQTLVQSFLIIPFALFVWDASLSRIISPASHSLYVKALPWKTTFLEPNWTLIGSPYSLKKPQKEEDLELKLQKTQFQAAKKPNIYLFILESLREDYITPENTPFLSTFKNEHISFDLSLSNANGTHISWFSLFFSDYPFRWSQYYKSRWKSGSPALQILKKLGYKIHVYSSAAFGYYGMDWMIFGKDHYLADSYHLLTHYHPKEAYQTDLETVSYFQEELEAKEGNVYIFFWDSTHFDYSWPKNETLFKPISEQISFFKPEQTEESLQLIKNRYKNALHYLDSLFGKVKETIEKKGLWDDAIIALTGDHGEEFYEQGYLFHASHLSHEQTNTPIYYKFPKEEFIKKPSLTSQMDIFPSILNYILKDNSYANFFEGGSIFDPHKNSFVFSSRYYASRAPVEFFIHDGTKKIIARFKDKRNIYSSKQIEVVALKDKNDKPLELPSDREGFIRKEFGEEIKRIFSPR